MKKTVADTIVAPATNIATQAIALLRISGDEAFPIINKLIKKPLPHKKGVYYRHLYDGKSLVDEVVITAFVGPRSFTGEDTIELAIHGGVLNTEKVLQLILKTGARLALKGEFSQRAYLNGKISLIQAEGINDLIHAPNHLALRLGVDNMHGQHQVSLIKLQEQLLDLISKIQVAIDYPDYEDVEGVDKKSLEKALKELIKEVKGLLSRSERAHKAIEGLQTIILGAPNVGKSSLLNALLNEDKAIVTNIPGTTRDIVEGTINLPNGTLKLIDTAGIRKTEDELEKLGIVKTLAHLKKAELVLWLTTPNQLQEFDQANIDQTTGDKKVFLIVNQIDKLPKDEIKKLKKDHPNWILISALNGEIDPLINEINNLFDTHDLQQSDDLILTNAYQISTIKSIINQLETALENLSNDYPIDIINVDLYQAWETLQSLLGANNDETIIDNIFRKYCLGK